MRISIRLFATLVALAVATPLWAGYEIQVNTVDDFPTTFHHVAVLPAIAPDSVGPLWVEQLIFEKLFNRKIRVAPSSVVRKFMFDLGVTTLTPESLKQIAARLQVDAFVIASVGSSGSEVGGAVATPIYGGGFFAAPIVTHRGSVEITIEAADSGKVLMHGIASGSSEWRPQKGVLGTMYDLIFDRCFTLTFFTRYTQREAAK